MKLPLTLTIFPQGQDTQVLYFKDPAGSLLPCICACVLILARAEIIALVQYTANKIPGSDVPTSLILDQDRSNWTSLAPQSCKDTQALQSPLVYLTMQSTHQLHAVVQLKNRDVDFHKPQIQIVVSSPAQYVDQRYSRTTACTK